MATRIDTSNKLLASRIPHDELTIRMDSGSCQLRSSFLHLPSPPPPPPSPPCLLAARGCLPSGLGPARVLFLVWPFPDWDSVALVECFWALCTVSIPPPLLLFPPLSTPLCLTFACRFSFMMMLLLFVFDQFVFFAIVVYFPSFMHFNLLANLSPPSLLLPQLSSLSSLHFLARHVCYVCVALSCVNCNVAFMCPRIKISILPFAYAQNGNCQGIVSHGVGRRKYTYGIRFTKAFLL